MEADRRHVKIMEAINRMNARLEKIMSRPNYDQRKCEKQYAKFFSAVEEADRDYCSALKLYGSV
jgi:hypothetical protein